MSSVLDICLQLGGMFVIFLGLALRLRTTVVVLAGALLTGLVAGLPLFPEDWLVATGPNKALVAMLGAAFADNRRITLFMITLPAIAMAERYGLQEQSTRLLSHLRTATTGRLLTLYQLFRISHGLLGFRFNGHPLFVRPSVAPMALRAAAGVHAGQLTPDDTATDAIKAAAAAAENYGNFYGQNLSPVQAGVLIVYGFMEQHGHAVTLGRLIAYAVPVVCASVVLARVQFHLLDRYLRRQRKVV
jgi:uncharacterized membrane protein